MKYRMREDVVFYGLVTLATAVLLVAANRTPVTQANVFDSPLPTPWAYLPFVASNASLPPLTDHAVYLPIVAHNWSPTPAGVRIPPNQLSHEDGYGELHTLGEVQSNLGSLPRVSDLVIR